MFQFNFEVSDEKDGGHVCDQGESQKNDVEASSSTQTKPNGNNGYLNTVFFSLFISQIGFIFYIGGLRKAIFGGMITYCN